MNVLTPISPLWDTMPLTKAEPKQTHAPGDTFADFFGAAVEAVRQTDEEKAHAQYLLATGQLDNPSVLQMSMLKADAATQMLVQLRDKALNAYSELSRMSV